MAIQPHLVLPGNARAIAKGLSAPHREFVLPLQIVRHMGDTTAGIELARHWVEHERGAEQVGAFLAHECGHGWECLAEVNATHAFGNGNETFAGIGARKAVSEHLKWMGALETQINGPSARRAHMVYFGIQLTPR